MNKITLEFSGEILERGFWIYCWKVLPLKGKGSPVFYVGRTGDSSSLYAASPFSRVGRHLDNRPKAKGNSLYRQLIAEGFEPSECEFSLIARGPIYSEQTSKSCHRQFRDLTASIEFLVYKKLKEHLVSTGLEKEGSKVIGNHGCRKPHTDETKKKANSIFTQIKKEFDL